jgi:hypothetical protein
MMLWANHFDVIDVHGWICERVVRVSGLEPAEPEFFQVDYRRFLSIIASW